MDQVEQKALADLEGRRKAMLAELAEHVAIPTGRGFEPGLREYREILVRRLEALGATIERVPGDPRPGWLTVAGNSAAPAVQPANGTVPETVVARRSGDGPRVLIAGHIDTVHDPEGPFRELTISPDGRTAKGPGAADMKGGILIALHALEALERVGAKLNWTFLLNADEETGSFHSAGALRREAGRHDWGIAVEPALTSGALATERMGSGQFKVEVFGRSAHVGREFTRGVSAVTRLGEILVELGRMAEPARGMIVNVGPLKGGSVTNAVPDYAACWGNLRVSGAEAQAELDRKLAALATTEDAMPRVVVHRQWNRPAKPMTENVRKLAELATGAARELGQELPWESTGGVCDGNILQDAGLPTIDTLGVRGGGLHTTDEWIETSSLVERGQLLALVLMRLARMS